MTSLVSFLPYLVVGLAASAAAVIDIRQLRVPNRLTFPLLLCGLLYHGAVGGLEGLQMSLFGAAFGLLSLIVAYVVGILGAGDVKLMAALGAWLGGPLVLQVLVFAILALCLYSAVVLIYSGGWRSMRANLGLLLFRIQTLGKHMMPDERVEEMAAKPVNRSSVVPFAVMIAIGCFCALIWQVVAKT